jgi:sarcosine oxidase subunit alpha
MSGQKFRNPEGGRIDRTAPLKFTFDGKAYTGYQGDTLAAALLANGVRVVGRSFKYHRPRGVFGAGFEEPNALVQLGAGARSEPNLQATRIELFDGLVASSQNRWPSLKFDISAINNVMHRFIPAGFYYKTFMAPASWWPTYEKFIRRAAGMGRAASDADPDQYTRRFAHCDVLIVGGGPAGLSAALAAGRTGATVILVEDSPNLGGDLSGRDVQVGDTTSAAWLDAAAAELASSATVTVLTRTTAAAYYDHNMLILCERVADHKTTPAPFEPRQRIWRVRAQQVVLATGAIERPLIFTNNDRPGVMLASAAQHYANAYGVRVGKRAVIFANNGSAYEAAKDLNEAGVEIAAIIDTRLEIPERERERAPASGAEILTGHAIIDVAAGKGGVTRGVTIKALDPTTGAPSGFPRDIACDLVLVSGGWTPSIHLFSQSKGKIEYDPARGAYVPGASVQQEQSAGAANGVLDLETCITEGEQAGAYAAPDANAGPAAQSAPSDVTALAPTPTPLPSISAPPQIAYGTGKCFVDFQNDVTAADIGLAHREGYQSVEHLKRYTTLGMGTDQGRTSNINGMTIMAGHRKQTIAALGVTTFRPPFSPVTLSAIAGWNSANEAPVRHSPLHDWHKEHGATFANTGLWRRPQYYPRDGLSPADCVHAEARQVREHGGVVDVSTLGKIDVQGRDALEFLSRVYINNLSKLAIGKCRYGVMLREDGFVFDDGTITRIAENRFLVTTTTTHAGAVMAHLEYLAQVDWPELDVRMVSVTEDWAGIAIAGPESRALLGQLFTGVNFSDAALPFMGFQEVSIDGVTARIFRISFSGELAYEINVPAGYALNFWTALLDLGQALNVIPYGTEAMNILRIEKGHVTGVELNGRVTAADLGFAGMMSKLKPFVGHIMARRDALTAPGRRQLVGLRTVDGVTPIPGGAQLIADPNAPTPMEILGEVTSNCYSPALDHTIGLGLLAGGRDRHGETLYAHSPIVGETVAVTIENPVFVDREGARLHG